MQEVIFLTQSFSKYPAGTAFTAFDWRRLPINHEARVVDKDGHQIWLPRRFISAMVDYKERAKPGKEFWALAKDVDQEVAFLVGPVALEWGCRPFPFASEGGLRVLIREEKLSRVTIAHFYGT